MDKPPGRPKGSKNKPKAAKAGKGSRKKRKHGNAVPAPLFDRVQPLIPPIDRTHTGNRINAFANDTYDPNYAKLILQFLTKTTRACNLRSIEIMLRASRDTVLRWKSKHPDFKAAVEQGLTINRQRWLEKMENHAYEPGYSVNLGLIKLLSNHIYGIKDDPEVVVHNTVANVKINPIQELKKRGIPLPDIEIEDIPPKKR